MGEQGKRRLLAKRCFTTCQFVSIPFCQLTPRKFTPPAPRFLPPNPSKGGLMAAYVTELLIFTSTIQKTFRLFCPRFIPTNPLGYWLNIMGI